MKLYYTTRSPYARKALILAKEKGIELECLPVDLMNKPESLLKLNPVGKIPVLVADDGRSFSDSQTICEFLDHINPDPRFIPEDTDKRLKVLDLDHITKGMMDVTVSIFFEKILHKDDPNEKFITRQSKTIQRVLSYLEDHVEELKEFHLASVGVVSAIGYLEFRMQHLWAPEKYPALAGWYKEIGERPSIRETVPVA